MNGQIVDIKLRDITIAYHPAGGEPRIGVPLLIRERRLGAQDDGAIVVQVIRHDSAGYPGDHEAALAELLEAAVAERHEIVRGEPAMTDLKEIKMARCKVRKRVVGGSWREWDGGIPSRNVSIEPIAIEELIAHTLPPAPANALAFCRYGDTPLIFEAELLDKVNAIVGVKGSGKSHTAKLLLTSLAGLGAPCWAFDINREFLDLPGADVIRVGDNYQLSLAEVGFRFLMAVVEDLNPLQDISRGAFEYEGPRLMKQQIDRHGFASIEYLLDRAGAGAFHSHDSVNQAIETRLRMVQRTGFFSDDPENETLRQRFERVTSACGFLVFDLAELPVGRLRAIVRGLNRQLDAICEDERRSGRGRYPFVFFEEAHFYASPQEILNLITRGRHLGLTTFFITNTPGELPEVIFRQLDNLIVTGLAHSADLRTIGKCSLSDEDTLQSLAVSLRPTQALIVGRLTGNFPLVVEIESLPQTFPPTGVTRSFWSRRMPRRRSSAQGSSQARPRRPRRVN
jgi:hypothetical protein